MIRMVRHRCRYRVQRHPRTAGSTDQTSPRLRRGWRSPEQFFVFLGFAKPVVVVLLLVVVLQRLVRLGSPCGSWFCIACVQHGGEGCYS